MSMLTFYVNRAGKGLPKERLATLEQASSLQQDWNIPHREESELKLRA